MESKKLNAIAELSVEFALDVIKYCEELGELDKRILANHLQRSGTTIGARIFEAVYSDGEFFVGALREALSRCMETEYWLMLCERAKAYPNPTGLKEKNKALVIAINRIFFAMEQEGK